MGSLRTGSSSLCSDRGVSEAGVCCSGGRAADRLGRRVVTPPRPTPPGDIIAPGVCAAKLRYG